MSSKPRTGPTRQQTMEMLGRTGLLALGGRVYDEWLLELQGYRGRRALREMADQDAVTGAILYALEMLIRQVHWSIDPADDSPEAHANATFVEDALNDMEETWPDTLAEICTMFVYGWSYHELLYKARRGPSDDPTTNSKYTDGKVGWRSWAVRGQESLDRWEFAPDGTLLGLWQIPPPDYRIRYVPYTKALLFRTTIHRGNPEGRPLLRNAYRSYYMKKNIETIEAIGVERDLAGFPVLYLPPNIVSPDPGNDEDMAASDAYFRMLTNIKRDDQEGAMLPAAYDERGNKLYDLKLLTTGGARQFDTNAIITRYATAIAQTVLADFLMLGHNQRGAQALSVSKVQLFNTAEAAVLDAIAAVVNARAIPTLLRMNAIADKFPTLAHGEIERTDLQALGTFIFNLAQAGAQLDLSPGSPLLSYLLEEANLPTDGASLADAGTPGPHDQDQPPPAGSAVPTRPPNAPNRPPQDAGQQAPGASSTTPEPGNSLVTNKPPRPPRRRQALVQSPRPA